MIPRRGFVKRAACIAFSALVMSCGTIGSGADRDRVINGRDVVLTTPAAGALAPAPLVIALHGGLGDARNFQSSVSLETSGGLQNARIAYLNGTAVARLTPQRLGWNAGNCCGLPERNAVNDVDYIASVIADLRRQGLIASDKVSLVGHSNGAMMALRFACERPDLVSDVVAISGQLVTNDCANAAGVRVLLLHGVDDTTVPIAGGIGTGVSGVVFRSSDQTRATLRAAGASVETDFVAGAAHRTGSIQRALRRRGAGSIGDVVAQFLRLRTR